MRSASSRQLPIQLPAGATDIQVEGPRPFVTHVTFRDRDGVVRHWHARQSRKADERTLTWWIGVLFAIGSTCFLIGPIPAYDEAVGPRATAMTYFIGSIFFTTAAYLSYAQVVRQAGHRWFGWTPRLMGYWATLIQFVGTLYFNATTFAGLLDVPADSVDRVVWRPDAIGSVCFLVSSAIAFAEAGHRWFSWRPGKRDWHITALNLWGSVFFGVSAVGAYVTADGDLVNLQWANGGTFLGAACFLVASLMMLPEGRQPAATPVTPTAA